MLFQENIWELLLWKSSSLVSSCHLPWFLPGFFTQAEKDIRIVWGYKQITEENSLPRRMTLTWPIFPWQKNPHEAEKVENDHWPQTSMRPHTHAWWSVPLAWPWTVYGDRDMGGPRKVHRWENSEKKVETNRKVELSINNRSSNMSRKLKICSSSRH